MVCRSQSELTEAIRKAILVDKEFPRFGVRQALGDAQNTRGKGKSSRRRRGLVVRGMKDF
jgi:hypothetical protein